MLSFIAALALAQLAPVVGDVCTKDADCLISTTECCPGCCGPGPYATSKTAEKQMREKCAVIECSGPPNCDIVCEPPASPDGFVAKCAKKTCVMRLKKSR